MNVLHLITGRGPTGPAAAAMLDVRALLAAGHKAWLACADSSALIQTCQTEGLPCVAGLKLGRGAARMLSLPRDARRLRGLIREMAIDVVHVHRSDDQLLAMLAIGRALTATLVRTWHRDPAAYPRLLRSRLLRHADGSLCVAREHEAALRGAGIERCAFLHPAVDTALFRPAEHEPAEVVLAHVGRWKRERDGRDRGQQAALAVFAKLSRRTQWKGLLVGRGEMEAELRRVAYAEHKLPEDRVQLLNVPQQSPAQFAQLLSTFSLGLVFATGSDGTSRAGVELLACGVPLLVADRPGLRELAEDQNCALRLLPDDPAGWARAVERMLDDPTQVGAMQRAARARAEAVHALKIRGEGLIGFYRSL